MAQERERERNVRDTARWVALGVIAVVLVVFIAQNYDSVEVELFVWDGDIELAWALLAAAILGFLGGLLLPRIRRTRGR